LKKFILLFFSVVLILLVQLFPSGSAVSKVKNKYTIVLHGGAGTISKSLPDSIKEGYMESLKKALQLGKDILEKGGSEDAMVLYNKFRGREPKVDALLVRRGLN